MGAVYEAVDERLGITVALKETFSADANVRKQFEQEARLLSPERLTELARKQHFIDPTPDKLFYLNPESKDAVALKVESK